MPDNGFGNKANSRSFPYVTVEAVVPIDKDELVFVNDTNFGSTGRNPGLPDDSDFIVVKLR